MRLVLMLAPVAQVPKGWFSMELTRKGWAICILSIITGTPKTEDNGNFGQLLLLCEKIRSMLIGRKTPEKVLTVGCDGCLSDVNCFHENSFTYGLVLVFTCIFRMVQPLVFWQSFAFTYLY